MTAWIVLALFSCKGPETNFRQLTPVIAVAPPELDFGEVAVPVTIPDVLYITNGGQATLSVSNVTIVGEGAGAFSLGATSNDDIPPGESWELAVAFQPATFLPYEATLQISSNDEENPLWEVALKGVGVNAPLPDIEVARLSMDYGTVPQDSIATDYLVIENVGTADLHLGALDQVGSGAFQIQSFTDPSYTTIAPGAQALAIVEYSPNTDAGDNATITISSDDPDEAEVEVLLLGNGGGDVQYPVADVDCNSLVEPPIWVNLDGSPSTDPEGHLPLTYSWAMTLRPPGSQALLTNQNTDNTAFFADAAGPYEVQLVVTNSIGTPSSPARCLVQAIPADELHVELTWDAPAADLDLHLLEDGAAFYEKPGDCNWCNKNPKWAQTGSDDDPRLDLDDRGGFGPENINLRSPQDGRYAIKVHYFEEHGDDAVTAIVRVYTFGVLSWEGSKVMYRNDVWDVARVNWPDGTVGVQSTPLYSAGTTRQCF